LSRTPLTKTLHLKTEHQNTFISYDAIASIYSHQNAFVIYAIVLGMEYPDTEMIFGKHIYINK